MRAVALRRARFRVEHLRRGADRFHADFDFDALFLRMRPHAAQIVRLEVADEADLREMDDPRALRRAVVEQLKWRPALRAQAEEIDPQLYGRRALNSLRRGLRREWRDAADGHHFPPRHAAIVSFDRGG